MKKTQIQRIKAAFLGLPILELSKIVMYEFKPKYGEKQNCVI